MGVVCCERPQLAQISAGLVDRQTAVGFDSRSRPLPFAVNGPPEACERRTWPLGVLLPESLPRKETRSPREPWVSWMARGGILYTGSPRGGMPGPQGPPGTWGPCDLVPWIPGIP